MTNIETLKKGDTQIAPRTVSKAVLMKNGQNLQDAFDNLNVQMGNISTAFGELHAYAQAIITGGNT